MENKQDTPRVTQADIRAAAYYWVGRKERETSQDDLTYFYANWAALPGMEHLVEAFARHRTTALAERDEELARMREALAKHNLRAANGDEITVADEMEQAAGTLEAFVEANKEHFLLDCTDNDDVAYQSEWMAGLIDHATIDARTLRKWARTLRVALTGDRT